MVSRCTNAVVACAAMVELSGCLALQHCLRDTCSAAARDRCAPEVLRSQSYNEKSDVYSFGVIMCATPQLSASDACMLMRLRGSGLCRVCAVVPYRLHNDLLQVGACHGDGALVGQNTHAGTLKDPAYSLVYVATEVDGAGHRLQLIPLP